MEARRDESLRAVFNAAGLAVPDGMPLVWVGRLRGRRDVRRVYGPDLTLQLCARAADRGHRCFFYGGGPRGAEQPPPARSPRLPGRRAPGAERPPLRPLRRAEDG